MIRRSRECVKELREHMRDGEGTVEILNLATPEELNDKGRLFAKITLHPGCSIGYHVHEKDSEIFYIIKGDASYSDNGETKIISAGDVTVLLQAESQPGKALFKINGITLVFSRFYQ